MAFKIGMDFGNSPITKKAGPETKKFDIDNNVDPFSDEETAYEKLKMIMTLIIQLKRN